MNNKTETLRCQDNFIKAIKEVADEITAIGRNKIDGIVTFGYDAQEVDIIFSIEVSFLKNKKEGKNIQALSQEEINEMNQDEYENYGGANLI